MLAAYQTSPAIGEMTFWAVRLNAHGQIHNWESVEEFLYIVLALPDKLTKAKPVKPGGPHAINAPFA